MTKKDTYVFPSIFHQADDGISIYFPDLPGCLPCGHTIDESLDNAKESLSLHLYGMEEDNEEIPEPTPIHMLDIQSNQALFLVEEYMPIYREAIDNTYVRKNVTLPLWLEKASTNKKINFSKVLQSALKERLGIKDK